MTAVKTDPTYDVAAHFLQGGAKLEIGKDPSGNVGGLDVLDGAIVREMAGGSTDDSGFMKGTGNLLNGVSVVSAGNGNGADTTADTLASVVIPARTFDIVGRCITLQAWGNVTATSATKTVSFSFGASLTQSIVQFTTTNTGQWQVWIQLFKTGANTQMALFQADAGGTTASLLGLSGGRALNISTAGTETDTAAITMKITGQSSVATANTVTCQGFIVDAFN